MSERAYLAGMARAWRCLLGLHRFVRRHDHPDPNMQVCAQCGKQRVADALWGVLGRRGPG